MSLSSNNKYYGSCMMDFTTLSNATRFLNSAGNYRDWLGKLDIGIETAGMKCLVNVVEALVLNEKIYVPFLSTQKPFTELVRQDQDQFAPALDRKIIDELRINRRISNDLIMAYKRYARSDLFAEIFVNAMRQIRGMSSHAELFRITQSSSGTPYLQLYDFEDGYTEKEELPAIRNFLEKARMKKEYHSSDEVLLTGNFIEKPFYKPIARFVLRGLSYNDIAKIASIPYVPHPLRVAFSMSESLWSCNITPTWGEIAIDYMHEFRKDYISSIGENIFDVDIPLIFSNVIRNCTHKLDIIPVALQMRETKPAQAFREWNKNVTRALYNNEGTKVVKAMQELRKLKQDLKKEFGYES